MPRVLDPWAPGGIPQLGVRARPVSLIRRRRASSIDRPAAGLEARLSTLTLVILGFVAFLVLLTVVLVFVIGIREAADEDQSAPEDLTDVERSLVDRGDEPEDRSST